MDYSYTPKPSVGKVIFSTAFAVILGALYPLMLMVQLIFPVLMPCFAVMLITALYAAVGIAPVIGFCATVLPSTFLGFGPVLGAAALPVCLIPTAVAILGIRGRKPFFGQMSRAIAAGMGGTVLSIVIAALAFGTDMVGQLMAQVQAAFEEMMPSLWSVQESLFASYGIQLTYEEYTAAYFDALKILERYYELYLPGNLLTGAAMTSMLAVFWGNWLKAKRGESTPESFAGLCDWYLPGNMTIGILLTLVVGLVISKMDVTGGNTAWIAVTTLAQFAFCVQFFAALDRRQKAIGASRKRRIFSAVMFVLLGMLTNNGTVLSLFFLMPLAGAGSALFGRKGVIRVWIEKNKGNMNGEDR